MLEYNDYVYYDCDAVKGGRHTTYISIIQLMKTHQLDNESFIIAFIIENVSLVYQFPFISCISLAENPNIFF